jgi:group I intron endonuclease
MVDVYLITNIVNGKKYVGFSSWGKDQRWLRHKSEARRGVKYPIYHAIRKYGEDSFEVSLLEDWETIEEAKEAEKWWIKILDATNREFGYNLKDGGEGNELPEETRERISNSHKQRFIDNPGLRKEYGDRSRGRKFSPEACANLSKARTGKTPNRVYVVSEKQRQDISNTLTEYFSDEKNREVISESLKNYYEQNPDRVEKIREESRENIKDRKRDSQGRLLPASGEPIPEKTEEEKAAINKKKSDKMLSKTPEEKAATSKKQSEAGKARYAKMTPEEREAFCKRKKEISDAYYAKKKLEQEKDT